MKYPTPPPYPLPYAPQKKSNGCLKIVLLLGAIFIGFPVIVAIFSNHQRAEEARKAEREFQDRRPTLLIELQKLLDEGREEELERRLSGLLSDHPEDADFRSLQNRAHLSLSRKKLVEENDPGVRIGLLRTVVALDSSDTDAAAELDRLEITKFRDTLKNSKDVDLRRTALEGLEKKKAAGEKELKELADIRKADAKAAKEKAELAAKEEQKRLRNERIHAAFSGWDGSMPNVVRLVKKSMHDPDSFEHVETRWADKGDYLLVDMTFRGKNAFGAKILNEFRAKTTLDGEVVEILKTGMPR